MKDMKVCHYIFKKDDTLIVVLGDETWIEVGPPVSFIVVRKSVDRPVYVSNYTRAIGAIFLQTDRWHRPCTID